MWTRGSDLDLDPPGPTRTHGLNPDTPAPTWTPGYFPGPSPPHTTTPDLHPSQGRRHPSILVPLAAALPGGVGQAGWGVSSPALPRGGGTVGPPQCPVHPMACGAPFPGTLRELGGRFGGGTWGTGGFFWGGGAEVLGDVGCRFGDVLLVGDTWGPSPVPSPAPASHQAPLVPKRS